MKEIINSFRKKSFLKAIGMMFSIVLLPFFYQNCAQPFEVSSRGNLSSESGSVSKTLSWDPSTDTSGNIDTSVTNYKVYIGESIGVYGSPLTVTPSVNPSVAINFEKGKTYYLAVSAVNSSGESAKATLTYTAE
ncbi:MAG: hypothetical protein A4S09_06080 [Proteobacteria bacterium SG_bin7]|nr:MAG: hypothetical protein A4S09_06080 [Proteobacteria bacterium SG_bin7]